MSFFLPTLGRRMPLPIGSRSVGAISTLNNIETTGISLDMIHTSNKNKTRNTKIVCTMGPACWSLGLLTCFTGIFIYI